MNILISNLDGNEPVQISEYVKQAGTTLLQKGAQVSSMWSCPGGSRDRISHEKVMSIEVGNLNGSGLVILNMGNEYLYISRYGPGTLPIEAESTQIEVLPLMPYAEAVVEVKEHQERILIC